MWVITPTLGFLSVVAHRTQPGFVLIRGRDPAHLRAVLAQYPDLMSGVGIELTPKADYGCRLTPVSHDVFAELVRREALSIMHGNFKAAAGERWGHGSAFVEALHRCWSALRSWQHHRDADGSSS